MNSIHPTALIGADVQLGINNYVGPHVVIDGPAVIGDDNWIGAGVVIGAPPEVRLFPHLPRRGEMTGNGTVIGNRNVIREYAQVHQGWQGKTVLGHGLFIMNQCYVAHDCTVEDDVTLASSVLLAGHVRVGHGANLGLGASVHQRRYVANGAMVGMGSVVTRDIPPFAKAYGNPVRVRGANTVGMGRAGIRNETIALTVATYRGAFDPSLSALDGAIGMENALAAWRQHASA
jgi:UDP-N-acetylglucosamine acyltransferase